MSTERPSPRTDDPFLTQPEPSARRSFGAAFERIVGLMARLRGPDGCPWDRSQDLGSLRRYLLEEAYEVLEAVETGGTAEHLEELGDLLLQVVFQAEIRREEGAFDAADVAHAIADKLVRRHPHVFADRSAGTPSEALDRWEEIKAKEKGTRSVIGGVPRELPGLLRAQRIQEKASAAGFDWPDASGAIQKLDEEVGELHEAIAGKERAAIEHELGDALFSLVNVARFLEIGAEDALRAAIDRFSRRFGHIEDTVRARGARMSDTPLEDLERLWTEAKEKESRGREAE